MAEEKQMLTQITFSDLSELEDANAEEDLDEIEDEEDEDEYGRAYCICKIPDAEDIKHARGKVDLLSGTTSCVLALRPQQFPRNFFASNVLVR